VRRRRESEHSNPSCLLHDATVAGSSARSDPAGQGLLVALVTTIERCGPCLTLLCPPGNPFRRVLRPRCRVIYRAVPVRRWAALQNSAPPAAERSLRRSGQSVGVITHGKRAIRPRARV
jgi:hypothetical protein